MLKEHLRRGSTPYLICTIQEEFDYSSIKTAWLTLWQNDKIILDKVTEDLTITRNTINILLTQEDTLAFVAGNMAEIQLRLLTDTDTAYVSQKEKVMVDGIIKDGVIR